MHKSIVLACLVVSFAACDRANSPSSPSGTLGSSPATTGPASTAASGPAQGRPEVPYHLLHPVQFPMEQGVVAFPPRNEPNLFYTHLQELYRDYLKRSQTAMSYVDPEGVNVWLTEYFRFYLNGCSHQEAMARTIEEIRTGGTQPVCGGESASPAFPPRNLPFEFQAALENTYRDMLGRQRVAYYVDAEGANVWLAEYLRYRLQGARCGHVEAENKVFAQIRGGGVQPVCGGVTYSDTVPAFGIDMWDLTITGGGTRALELALTWSDPSADLDLYLTSASCNAYPPEGCSMIAVSVRDAGTSEQIRFSANSGERYRVWIDNRSFEPQSYELTPTNNQGALPAGDDTGVELSRGTGSTARKLAGARKIR